MTWPNCKCLTRSRRCTHPGAPRRWFGLPGCIEIIAFADFRANPGCAVRIPFVNPITVHGMTLECPPVPPMPPRRASASGERP